MPFEHPALVRALRRQEHAIAEAVTEAFLTRHPDWVSRYGDRARSAGIEDARFHVQFLTAAIESGSLESFKDYVRWTTRVLESRGIDRAFLRENLLQVQEAAAALLSADQAAVVARFLALPDAHTLADDPSAAAGPLALTRSMYTQAILLGDRRASLTIANEALDSGAAIEDLYADVFQESLYEVGHLWERNAITVAQEHMATAVTQFVMAQVFDRIARPEVGRGVAVLTGVPGEMHHVGALMVADMLEARGWQVRFLGSNLPIASIVAAVGEAKADLLGVSVTMLFNLHHAARLIEAVRALERPSRVVVGGAAFRAGAAWRDTGADAYAADVRDAIALLCP